MKFFLIKRKCRWEFHQKLTIKPGSRLRLQNQVSAIQDLAAFRPLLTRTAKEIDMKSALFFLGALFSLAALADYTGLGTESISSEQLKKFAPPPLDPVMVNKLKKMFDVTSPGMGALSP